MGKMRKLILLGVVISFFGEINEKSFGASFGGGASICRDYLNTSPRINSSYFAWFQGYLNASDRICTAYKNPNPNGRTISCLSDKIYHAPGIGATLNGQSNYADDLQERLFQSCYNDPDQTILSATTHVITQLNKEFYISLFP